MNRPPRLTNDQIRKAAIRLHDASSLTLRRLREELGGRGGTDRLCRIMREVREGAGGRQRATRRRQINEALRRTDEGFHGVVAYRTPDQDKVLEDRLRALKRLRRVRLAQDRSLLEGLLHGLDRQRRMVEVELAATQEALARLGSRPLSPMDRSRADRTAGRPRRHGR